jgi:uncharacterized protein YcgI (DUF1989 family)
LALRVSKGQRYKVLNTHGTQIVDHWAFNGADIKEFMSMEHCRVAIDKLSPVVGDAMVTNKRRPIITLLEDTSPGVHDTLVAACDIHRYRQLGAKDHHDNCTDNLGNAMTAIGLTAPETPCPFNLFQNTQYVAGTGIQYLPTVSKPGQYVVFRAEMDAVVVFSACPQDMLPVNSGRPTEAHVELL